MFEYLNNILIGEGLLDNPFVFSKFFCAQTPQVMIVTDDIVAPLYLDKLILTLQKIPFLKQIDYCIIPHGDNHKTLETAQGVFTQLIVAHHYRETILIALGGGVVGDLTGFCAACYLRGVDFIQMPTTLLAQVDAAIGGKTGVNHPLGKNLIGAFYQPKGVVCDVALIKVLPQREFIAGLAEVIKYGLALDAAFFVWVENNIEGIMGRQSDKIQYLVHQSVTIKSRIVSEDEREAGNRVFLNFGHTLAHALEAVLQFEPLSHGEAVSIGMVAAVKLSQAVCQPESDILGRLEKLLMKIGLPTRLFDNMGVTLSKLNEAMLIDKKNKKDKNNWVLLNKLGDPILKSDIPVQIINKILVDLGAV